MIQLSASEGLTGKLSVLVCDRLVPKEAAVLPVPKEPAIVAANWLSPRTRDLLTETGYGYIDQTGNTRVTVGRPGLVVLTDGAGRDPSPKPKQGPNIRGPRAWALLRTMAEVLPPYGVGELAETIDANPGYISRLLEAISNELLIGRRPRGPVEHVEWQPVLRLMATSYSLLRSNETSNWVASAGPNQLLEDLAGSGTRGWAVTGSFGAAPLVSVAAPEIAVVYADDPELIANLTKLQPVRTGGNVVIARPYDQIVFKRTWNRDGITYASPAQIAVDCLTGPGRMPAEGDALLEWMDRRAPSWQAVSLHQVADQL
ncbi:MAG: hypothetical protein KTV68_19080 [Acidimicrobiia bacterium]|nr:hypothetical protein [Acidimicrobiia bacterium]